MIFDEFAFFTCLRHIVIFEFFCLKMLKMYNSHSGIVTLNFTCIYRASVTSVDCG